MTEKSFKFGAHTPLSFVEWAFAVYDEASLEKQKIGMLADDSDWSLTYRAVFTEALRMVDALKLSGKYQEERSRLQKIIVEAQDEASRESHAAFTKNFNSPEMVDFKAVLYNLLAGIRSPDPQQRARFLALMDELELWDKTPREVSVALLRALERAKLPKGRKSIPTPWANVTEHMDAMRLVVAGGLSIYHAALARAALARTAGEAERSRTLAKLYRQKLALRE